MVMIAQAARRRRRRVAAWLVVAASALPGALAHQVEHVQLEERQTLPDSAEEVTLQGAGVFSYAFLQVYVCALYLTQSMATSDALLEQDQARRITLVMLRDVSARTFVWALEKGLAENVPAPELDQLEPQIKEMANLMLSHRALRIGDRIDMDYLPERGTRVLLNGRTIGEVFPDKRFNDALLRVWLGERPLDPSLKPKLLGNDRERR